MRPRTHARGAAEVRAVARPLRTDVDLDGLVERATAVRLVLIGEASHGTEEFYAWRDRLTRRLVAEHGFAFMAVEGDWPDCRRLHRFVVGDPAAPDDPDAALAGYDRWPTWMWANTAVRDAAVWLRGHNAARPAGERVGFHGLDGRSGRVSLTAAFMRTARLTLLPLTRAPCWRARSTRRVWPTRAVIRLRPRGRAGRSPEPAGPAQSRPRLAA